MAFNHVNGCDCPVGDCSCGDRKPTTHYVKVRHKPSGCMFIYPHHSEEFARAHAAKIKGDIKGAKNYRSFSLPRVYKVK